MIPYCNFEGIGLIPWSPLAAGKLTRPVDTVTQRGELAKKGGDQNTEADKTIINRVEEIAKKRGWSMAQVATAWSMSKVSSPIIGFSSVRISKSRFCGADGNFAQIERVEEALLGDKALTEEEIKYLEEPYVPRSLTLKTCN